MLLKLEDLRTNYKESELNHWHCPTCIKGILKIEEAGFNHKESEYSLRKKPIGEDKEGVFSGILVCSQDCCKESVGVSGFYTYKKMKIGKVRKYHPTYFLPAIPIFDLYEFGDYISEEVHEAVEKAFELFWVDTNSCANKIRVAIEELLTDKKIPKFGKKSNGKRYRLSTHERIEKYRLKHPEKSSIANQLMAIKWIGNDGSHAEDEMDKEDILKGFFILYHTMYKLTDAEKILDGMVNGINKRRTGRYIY
jgi:hypothetical protein